MEPEAFTQPAADAVKSVTGNVAKETFDALKNPQSFGGGLLTLGFLVAFSGLGMWFITRPFRRRRGWMGARYGNKQ